MSTSTSGNLAISAQWVLPVGQPPVRNAAVVLDGDRISAIVEQDRLSRAFSDIPVVDYGAAAIVPGFINLHTHLDYSALRLFDTDSPLLTWIQGLVGRAFQWTPDQWQDSARLGARAVALSGTTCIADASYSGAAAQAAAEIGLRAVVGLELFGVNTDDAKDAWQDWLDRKAEFEKLAGEPLKDALNTGLVRLTVAPHAPYSVCPDLWKHASEWAESRGLPILVHLAESTKECEWIAGSEPEMDKFLSMVTPGEIGPLEWKGHGLSPTGHLAKHGLLTPGTLAAHCVQLDDEDIALLKTHSVKVAHCPRSNSRLRNGIAPLSRLRKAGIDVGLGTDSAASNDNLDLRNEAAFAVHLHRAVEPASSMTAEDALYMMTLGAAKALGLDAEIGSLESGKKADIAVFSLTDWTGADVQRIEDLLVYGSCPLRALFVDGKHIVKVVNLTAGAPA